VLPDCCCDENFGSEFLQFFPYCWPLAFRQETNNNPRKNRRGFFFLCFKKKLETVYIVFYQQLPAAIIVARSLLLLQARVAGLGFVESLRSIGAHFAIIFGSSFVDLGFGLPRTKPIMGSLMAGWSTNPLDAQSGLYSNL
jgi:hypothetical protein